ncbi:MAG: diguanylate cyclase, partial [Proteobacteria bacterium]|nr:diguanylate cyclase [Pseudomonadota bacterium]
IAERLQEKVKKPDIIARIADNGFGIIIYEADITNKDKLTKNIKKLVLKPFIVDNTEQEIQIDCTIKVVHHPIMCL